MIVRHSPRTFVERVDFVTSVGYGDGPGDRERLGLRGRGPVLVITDLGVLEPDPDDLRADADPRCTPASTSTTVRAGDRLAAARSPSRSASPSRPPTPSSPRCGPDAADADVGTEERPCPST